MIENIDFNKYPDGLVPAIIQDSRTSCVLMLGFMNADALEATRSSGKVTFFSRSKQRLWIKGETSGNFLALDDLLVDCDADTVLIKATPAGPVCHTGAATCFGESDQGDFLYQLENTIRDRQTDPSEASYTARLFAEGIDRIAQKVGEEAVEVVIAAKNGYRDRIQGEAADLLYHLIVLLREKDIDLRDVVDTLRQRSK